MQRGVGFCTVRSTPEREQAAVTFLKWLTEPERNVEFVTQAGYMPVTRAAFENELPKAIEGLESAKYASLYDIVLRPWGTYWVDVDEKDLPNLYDSWYLPLIDADEPMPDSIG